MARGDMAYTSNSLNVAVEILNRSPFEGVSCTIDFTSVSDTDSATGKKIVKAGTPITEAGVPVKTTPWTGAAGILLHDVYADRPQGTILKKAYINSTVAQAHSGLTYDDDLDALFPMIVFEPAI